jgi:transketolase
MALSRQKVPACAAAGAENLSAKGAYQLLAAEGGEAQVTIFATGTEVGVAVAARDILQARASRPAWSRPLLGAVRAQPAAYRKAGHRRGAVRVAVEAAIRMGWERFIGEDGVSSA